MSYILEALRRSQAERERGRVPGLDAQPAQGPSEQDGARGLPATWIGGGVAAAALLAATLAAVWWMRPPPAGPLASAPAPPADVVMRPVQPPVPTPLAQPPLPQVVSAPTTLPAPPPPAVQPAPAPARSGATAMPQSPSLPAVPQAPAQAQSPSPPPLPLPQPQTAGRPVPLAELNADQRRELPAMVIGGSIWSDSAANRFVIVNGQLVREGEAAAPGATLERIGPKSLILRWRDLRVEVPL